MGVCYDCGKPYEVAAGGDCFNVNHKSDLRELAELLDPDRPGPPVRAQAVDEARRYKRAARKAKGITGFRG